MKNTARRVRRFFTKKDPRVRKVLLQIVRDLVPPEIRGEALSSHLLAMRKEIIPGRLQGVRFVQD